jgi:hypothetical protein
MPGKSRSEQPSSSRSDIERDLGEIDKLKTDFDQELSRSEKSGDFTKSLTLKKEIDARVATLKARMETVQAFEPEPAPSVERADLEFAEKLFGKDYLGPEALSKVWRIEVKPDQVPTIPFSQPELERAKKLNQFLILRAKKAPDGSPLTMLKMHELLSPDMETKGRGKLLVNPTDQWKLDSAFFTTDTPVGASDQDFAWALTAKEILPGSTSKHYVEQTGKITEYVVKELYMGRRVPDQYQDALQEYLQYMRTTFGSDTYEQIQQKLAGPNWKTYADQLTNLKINQLLRQSPSQALFDVATYYRDQDKRLLENTYIWTNTQVVDSRVVLFGRFGTRGAVLNWWEPSGANDDLAVLVSRTS